MRAIERNFSELERITIDPRVMGGKPCIRGIRITVGAITGLLAAGESIDSVLQLYPSLERDDIYAALGYASWRSEEYDILPQHVGGSVLETLDVAGPMLEAGALVTIDPQRRRVRLLPLRGDQLV